MTVSFNNKKVNFKNVKSKKSAKKIKVTLKDNSTKNTGVYKIIKKKDGTIVKIPVQSKKESQPETFNVSSTKEVDRSGNYKLLTKEEQKEYDHTQIAFDDKIEVAQNNINSIKEYKYSFSDPNTQENFFQEYTNSDAGTTVVGAYYFIQGHLDEVRDKIPEFEAYEKALQNKNNSGTSVSGNSQNTNNGVEQEAGTAPAYSFSTIEAPKGYAEYKYWSNELTKLNNSCSGLEKLFASYVANTKNITTYKKYKCQALYDIIEDRADYKDFKVTDKMLKKLTKDEEKWNKDQFIYAQMAQDERGTNNTTWTDELIARSVGKSIGEASEKHISKEEIYEVRKQHHKYVKMYLYLLEKEGKDAAEQYLSEMDSIITEQLGRDKANEYVKKMKNDDGTFKKSLDTFVKGTWDGMESFRDQIGYWASGGRLTIDDYERMYILDEFQKEDPHGYKQFFYKHGVNFGYSLPIVAASSVDSWCGVAVAALPKRDRTASTGKAILHSLIAAGETYAVARFAEACAARHGVHLEDGMGARIAQYLEEKAIKKTTDPELDAIIDGIFDTEDYDDLRKAAQAAAVGE